jgi:hypothetical protein
MINAESSSRDSAEKQDSTLFDDEEANRRWIVSMAAVLILLPPHLLQACKL